MATVNSQPFIDSVMGAVNETANFSPSPNQTAGNQGSMQALQAASALQGQGDAARAATGSMSQVSSQDVVNEDEARRKAAKKAKEELAKEEAKLDPSNYIAEVNDQGGYSFYDPEGRSISLVDYAKVTNKRVTDILKDSESPDDQDFLEDYGNVMEMGRIMQRGNAEERDKFFEKNPALEEAYRDTPYEEVVADLRSLYPEYFRGKELNQTENQGKTPAMVGAPEEDPRNVLGKFRDTVIPSFLGNEKSATRWWN